ncbi:hypothetical protein QUF61_15700 [Candidatus Venteria ishoeyi]|uniref:hypothetical protein n=1 Tax=Candidatus Venteria ishoeyi TaxID=1899563 RepID=UPI0025A597A7|nr:hypothetical protein [Candidatus Venteria ishoeyi]MDM8547932.1 hypothetical protein [Candidatus Venteria ishoeyi]
MKKIFAVCLLPLFTLTGCVNVPNIKLSSGDAKKPLNTTELRHPNVKFTFQDTGKTYRSGSSFTPPKTIDCSKLNLKPDSFEDAIEAGALVVRIETPKQVRVRIQTPQQNQLPRFFNKQPINNKEDKETYKVVNIKPVYGGVLALCNVSESATGPDSRSYRIRGLNDYFVKGKDGLVSVVGAVLNGGFASRDYSWMLWLTDRTATFTDYHAEMSRRKLPTTPPK